MNLSEITQLIEIRNYVVSAINNFSISRETVKQLNDMLLLMDKQIIEVLTSDEFKTYINYKDINKVVAEAVKNSNIKSSLKPQNKQ